MPDFVIVMTFVKEGVPGNAVGTEIENLRAQAESLLWKMKHVDIREFVSPPS